MFFNVFIIAYVWVQHITTSDYFHCCLYFVVFCVITILILDKIILKYLLVYRH